jgi:hypothetical protein
MASPRDIRIPVMTTVEEYVALRAICAEAGQSMSGYVRNLIREDIAAYAHRATERDEQASAKEAQP